MALVVLHGVTQDAQRRSVISYLPHGVRVFQGELCPLVRLSNLCTVLGTYSALNQCLLLWLVLLKRDSNGSA